MPQRLVRGSFVVRGARAPRGARPSAAAGRACAPREGFTDEGYAGRTLGGGRGRSGTLAIYAVRRRFSAFGVRTRLGRFADMSSRCSSESLRAIFSDRLRSARALAAGSAPSAFQSSLGARRALELAQGYTVAEIERRTDLWPLAVSASF